MEIYLIVNWILVQNNEILVGATDSERWQWDIDDGESGADAKSHVWAVLKETESGYVQEEVGLYCDRRDPLRKVVMSHIDDLFSVAWNIREKKMDQLTARKEYFGYVIKD